jgi:hypothetical protein
MSKGVSWFVLILITVILILGGVVFFLLQNKSEPEAELGLADALLENQETDWQEHTSPLGYSLQYPAKYFQVKNENENSDTFTHLVGGDQMTAGVIYMKRQKTNISDLEQIYNLISTNLKNSNPEGTLLEAELINKKNQTLENGQSVIEFDQTGVEEYHNIILVHGGYVYNLGYNSKSADSLLTAYFEKMYQSISFSSEGVAKANWQEHLSEILKVKFSHPKEFTVQESPDSGITIISPEDNLLYVTKSKPLSLEARGRQFVVPAAGKNAVINLEVSKETPLMDSVGYGNFDNFVYLTVQFRSENAQTRLTDWRVFQEIIKTFQKL